MIESGVSLESRSVCPLFVLLGASNLTLGLPTVLATLAAQCEDVEMLIAHGFGRSYCGTSRFAARELPSVLDCGIWSALAERPADRPVWALVSDVGNDLAYGRTPSEIIERVGAGLAKLKAFDARVVVVRPPVERLLLNSATSYAVAKSLLFPGRVQPWPEMREKIVALDELLGVCATEAGAAVVRPELDWYGVDPIHIRARRQAAAWSRILNGWPWAKPVFAPRTSSLWNAAVWRHAAEQRRIMGRILRRDQPLRIGAARIWMY